MPRPPNLQARERILNTALELLHNRGYKGVSMDDIASKAGVKKANLFHYYPTKDALVMAVFDRAADCYRKSISARFANGGDPIKTVEAMFSSSASRMRGDDCCRGCFIGNLAQEISDHNEKLRRKVSEHLQFWSGQLSSFLERHRAAGYFRKELDPAQSAQGLLSLLEGAILFCKANKKVDALGHAKEMAGTYLKTFKRRG